MATINGTINNDILYGNQDDNQLYGDAGDDALYGGSGNEDLYGGEGSDILYGGSGNNNLFGGSGSDVINHHYEGSSNLYGGEGEDYFDFQSTAYNNTLENHVYGGVGDDYFKLGYGVRYFYYNAGDGHDKYSAALGGMYDSNVLVLGAGFSKQDVVVEFDVGYKSGLYVYLNSDRSSSIYLSDFAHEKSIDEIRFADGSILTAQEIKDLAGMELVIQGGDENDYLVGAFQYVNYVYGGGGDDYIRNATYSYGGDGDDYVLGTAGDDVFVGGKGNDSLIGQGGGDTFVYNLGDGYDFIVNGVDSANQPSNFSESLLEGSVLRFGDGIEFSDISIEVRRGGLLYIGINKGGLSGGVSIGSQGYSSVPFFDNEVIHKIEFFDGFSLSKTDIKNILGEANVYGLDQDDSGSSRLKAWDWIDSNLYGGLGDDELEANGLSNSYIEGGVGNDTVFLYNANHG